MHTVLAGSTSRRRFLGDQPRHDKFLRSGLQTGDGSRCQDNSCRGKRIPSD